MLKDKNHSNRTSNRISFPNTPEILQKTRGENRSDSLVAVLG
jgi:hypothetical protein